LFPAGFVGSPNWFRHRPQGDLSRGRPAKAALVPGSSGIANAGRGGQLRKEGLAHKATRVADGTLELVIASASASRKPAAPWGFPVAPGIRPTRQDSLSCAPCCAALSLGTIPINESAVVNDRSKKAPPMTGILQDYLPLVVFIGVAGLIGLVLLIAPFLVAFQQPDPEKLSAYECGFNAFDDARMKFDVRFYLVAILFIIFDLEVAFLFPWAVAFGKLGATGFWSMLVFLAVLTVGFAYEWKKGALEWD
jgi:NADH-quinone oxidoreductase subunit A